MFSIATPKTSKVARNVVVQSSKNPPKKRAKIDPKQQGVERTKVDPAVYSNLIGRSRTLDKKDFVDPSGKKGKGMGVYRFQDKYGTNVDGYSPIYTPDIWSETGERYALGTKGLLAWAALIVILLGVGLNLIVSTSAI